MLACPEIYHAVGHTQQPGVSVPDIRLGYQRIAVGQSELHAGIDPPGTVQPGGTLVQSLCLRSQMGSPLIVSPLTGILGQLLIMCSHLPVFVPHLFHRRFDHMDMGAAPVMILPAVPALALRDIGQFPPEQGGVQESIAFLGKRGAPGHEVRCDRVFFVGRFRFCLFRLHLLGHAIGHFLELTVRLSHWYLRRYGPKIPEKLSRKIPGLSGDRFGPSRGGSGRTRCRMKAADADRSFCSVFFIRRGAGRAGGGFLGALRQRGRTSTAGAP